jgi:hypothetical protein
MYRKPSKKKELIKRVSIYSLMTVLVVIIVAALIFIILGYRISKSGQIEQDALVQFASTPSGASVAIDGKPIGSNTSTKSTISAGTHTFTMTLANYQPWTKTQKVEAGVLTWLNYALLVPKSLPVTGVESYPTVFASLASPNGRLMLIQQKNIDPTFQIDDLTSDTVKSTTITIPATAYTADTTVGDTNTFAAVEWDPGGRYLLVQHTYGATVEWIVVDTQNVSSAQNLTTLYALSLSSVHFAGTSGTALYALTSGDIRKIDLSGGTISRSLASNVTSFSVYNTNVVTYIGTGATGTNQRVVGEFRDGDASPSILRTTTSDPSVPLLVATTHYFNDDYVAIAEGDKVDILSGNYPSGPKDTTSLKSFASYVLTSPAQSLGFSPSGDYAFTQSGNYFTSYSLEYNTYAQTTVAAPAQLETLHWLTDNDLWSDQAGTLTLREVDGANIHAINTLVEGQDATLTSNGRYLYSIGTTKTGFQLQRVRMIL